MPWRWGWPPWEPERLRADRQEALDRVERATVDLSDARRRVARADHITNSLRSARVRNHFSESMEALFTTARPHGQHGHHGPQQQGG